MRIPEACRCLAILSILASSAIALADGPGLGKPADPELIRRMDLTILPDGKDLPPGRGSVKEGKAVYEAKCLACHGVDGRGDPMDRLTGGVGSLTLDKPLKTVNSYWPYATTVFDYIRRAMPLPTPQTLTADEVYGLTAYILSIDGVVKPDAVMDARTLPKVKMPNSAGFVNWQATSRR